LKVLILGCGYLGLALARAWQEQGAEVWGWVRQAESAAALEAAQIHPILGDLNDPAGWNSAPREFQHWVHCASSSRGGAEAYRTIYVQGLKTVLTFLGHTPGVFVSSSSVYGQNDGSIVTELSPAHPTNETSRILREAEDIAVAAGITVARAAGIYGPNRGVLWRKFQAGEAVIEGDGSRYINQIHRDDLAAAVLFLATHGDRGGIYNICDNEPVRYLDFYQWLATATNRPLPPFGPVNTERKRGLTNKRVENQKLLALGWQPRYPTFREGLREEIEQLNRS
jgi:nucleoside-diphosphate-sugar epimerase